MPSGRAEKRSGAAAAEGGRASGARERRVRSRRGCADGGDDDDGRSADPVEVRERLVEALELDLVGPWPGHDLDA